MAKNDVAPTAEPVGEDRSIPVATITRLAIAGALVAIVVVFVVQNLDNVSVNFLTFEFDVPLIVLLVIAAVAGVVLRWLIGYLRARRRS